MATSLTLGASGADVNPLLVESTAPHGAPQFTQITNEHYKPAFEQAVREARADIAAIDRLLQENRQKSAALQRPAGR